MNISTEWLHIPEGTISGHPQAIGEVASADCAVVQELGSKPGLASNAEIVDHLFSDARLIPLPLFVSGSLERTIRERAAQSQREVVIVHAFEGQSAAGISENLGTNGEWKQFLEHPEVVAGKYRRPVLVTSGYNAGNSVRQAGKLASEMKADVEFIVPGDLPRTHFDAGSDQIWTKSWLAWVLTSHVRIARLRRKGH